ncbi:EamA family transporter RarD [Microbacterium betulae]|uniref:EamA family transporter RarD n=1 Tax=Microbacterium betulae TaxID=2981139 RepID=A0AA97I7Y1_9MICO|nr:EamA family transporter RarD [Microbacterium sp. AB]WOF24762.1 EamA family transporter RarD [Microbacterium sp. AB]
MQRPAPTSAERERALGTGYGLGAYVLWGVLPLYFVFLAPTGPWEVVGWRVLLSLVFCALLLTATRGWGRMLAVLRNRRLASWTALAGVLIYVNWQAFLIATQSGHVIEVSLGYFINPITTVLLAVVVLRERLRPAQWAAIGIAAVAVVVIVVAYGAVPWISLIVTASFGVYGLVKNRIGPAVDAVSGLALETMWLAPIAVVQLVVVAVTTGITYGSAGVGHTVLLSLAGVATAVPLLLFASGARRVSLTTVGLLQFAAPILQFICGAYILGEPMPTERWIGFGIVWVALVVLTVDMVRNARRSRRLSVRAAEPVV